MATKKITFDPDAGVPVASNLTIYGGANLMFLIPPMPHLILLIGRVPLKCKKV